MKNLLNKRIVVKVVCGVLMLTMVGCYSENIAEQEGQQVQQEQQVEADPVTPEEVTEEPEEVTEEPEVQEDPVIKDEYITPE